MCAEAATLVTSLTSWRAHYHLYHLSMPKGIVCPPNYFDMADQKNP